MSEPTEQQEKMSNSAMPIPPKGYRLIATDAQKRKAFPKRVGDMVFDPIGREWIEIQQIVLEKFSEYPYARRKEEKPWLRKVLNDAKNSRRISRKAGK